MSPGVKTSDGGRFQDSINSLFDGRFDGPTEDDEYEYEPSDEQEEHE